MLLDMIVHDDEAEVITCFDNINTHGAAAYLGYLLSRQSEIKQQQCTLQLSSKPFLQKTIMLQVRKKKLRKIAKID